jgi:hypothetical protein
MKTKTLTGKDKYDLDKQQWDWQSGSKIVIGKQWPDERLPLTMSAPRFGAKIEARDQFSRRIDYED